MNCTFSRTATTPNTGAPAADRNPSDVGVLADDDRNARFVHRREHTEVGHVDVRHHDFRTGSEDGIPKDGDQRGLPDEYVNWTADSKSIR